MTLIILTTLYFEITESEWRVKRAGDVGGTAGFPIDPTRGFSSRNCSGQQVSLFDQKNRFHYLTPKSYFGRKVTVILQFYSLILPPPFYRSSRLCFGSITPQPCDVKVVARYY